MFPQKAEIGAFEELMKQTEEVIVRKLHHPPPSAAGLEGKKKFSWIVFVAGVIKEVPPDSLLH